MRQLLGFFGDFWVGSDPLNRKNMAMKILMNKKRPKTRDKRIPKIQHAMLTMLTYSSRFNGWIPPLTHQWWIPSGWRPYLLKQNDAPHRKPWGSVGMSVHKKGVGLRFKVLGNFSWLLNRPFSSYSGSGRVGRILRAGGNWLENDGSPKSQQGHVWMKIFIAIFYDPGL